MNFTLCALVVIHHAYFESSCGITISLSVFKQKIRFIKRERIFFSKHRSFKYNSTLSISEKIGVPENRSAFFRKAISTKTSNAYKGPELSWLIPVCHNQSSHTSTFCVWCDTSRHAKFTDESRHVEFFTWLFSRVHVRRLTEKDFYGKRLLLKLINQLF